MDFSDTQAEILGNAYWLAREGKGQVVQPECLPDAHELYEAGWLDRKIEENGDISWWWSLQAEGALRLRALMDSRRRTRCIWRPTSKGCGGTSLACRGPSPTCSTTACRRQVQRRWCFST
jgi:hypothetical protein